MIKKKTYHTSLLAIFLFMAFFMPVKDADATESPSKETHVIALDNYPPYHFWIDDTPKGLHVELIDEVFHRLGLTPTYIRMPWKRSLHAVEHGDVTALCAGMKTPSREEFAFYPSQNLSLETNWVISLAESDVQISNIEDLKDHTIGTVTAYSYGPTFDSLQNLRKFGQKNESILLDLLINQRIDVIIGCDLVVHSIATKNGINTLLKYQYKLSSDPLYLIFSKAVNGNNELSQKTSDILAEMRNDGTYQHILNKYNIDISSQSNELPRE